MKSEVSVAGNGWSHWFHWNKGGKIENKFQLKKLVHYQQIDGAPCLLADIIYQLYEIEAGTVLILANFMLNVNLMAGQMDTIKNN